MFHSTIVFGTGIEEEGLLNAPELLFKYIDREIGITNMPDVISFQTTNRGMYDTLRSIIWNTGTLSKFREE